MKKLIVPILLLFILTVIPAFTGCSAEGENTVNGNETANETAAENVTGQTDYEKEAARLREALALIPEGPDAYVEDPAQKPRLTSFGEWTPDAQAFSKIEAEVKKLTDEGFDLGFVMLDIRSGCGVSFDADHVFHSQSTIKGPYIASVYEAEPQSFADHTEEIRKTIQYSDNDCYESVRHTYHSDPIRVWTERAGLRDAIASGLYVQYSAREFAALWTEMYRFFHTTNNQELADYYIGSEFSCTYNELKSDATVHSKAGWEDGVYGGSVMPQFTNKDPYDDEVATNDGALVTTENGEYIFVIMSDVPASFARLQPVVRAVFELYSAMSD